MTFVRVYVNLDTSKMYQYLFKRVFDLIQERTGLRNHWYHIHKKGHTAIIMDMDLKLSTGKNLYLILLYLIINIFIKVLESILNLLIFDYTFY